ncbi:MAG: sigma-70 family RNA polymerase sigma factor [Acidobacteria bacterium]|nr:sigma-70 family RNA polymerase sigma factor [Acidobacteriota bacterium]
MKQAVEKIAITTLKSDASKQTDESLIATLSSGNEEAFNEIFERYRFWVARIVGRFFRRPERVEEIVQEVFTKLYFTSNYFSPQPGKTFANWLSSITINFCYDELRRLKRRPEQSISDLTQEEVFWLKEKLTAKESSSAETQVIFSDLATKLLSQLSPEDRLVLTLLDVEELSVNEIAKVTGWSVSKVKIRAYRARLSLRSLLKNFL